MHVRAALRNGLTPEEMRRCCSRCGVYAGVRRPTARSQVAQQIADAQEAG